MQQITVKVPDDTAESLANVAESQFDGNRSKAIRELLQRGIEYESLETENERLRRKLEATNSQERDIDDIVAYVDEERQLQREERERRRAREQAPIWRRWKWYVFGLPDSETAE
jgi:metal-responsive CopG/Arc/MetJ family transcriptional regulator